MYNYILVIDDDVGLAYAIKLYLSSKEKKIFVVDNPIAAIKLLNLYQFNIVISDIMMPDYSGYDLLSYLRLDNCLFSIPFIFLTAKGMTSDRIKGYDLGCSIYLTKPFHPSELLSIVNNILFSQLSNSTSYTSNLRKENRMFNAYLTNREHSILQLLVQGLTNKEIAYTLGISIRNVEKYVSRLLGKTNTRNRTELAQFFLSKIVKANDGTRTRE